MSEREPHIELLHKDAITLSGTIWHHNATGQQVELMGVEMFAKYYAPNDDVGGNNCGCLLKSDQPIPEADFHIQGRGSVILYSKLLKDYTKEPKS